MMKITRRSALMLAILMILSAFLPLISVAEGESAPETETVADNPGLTSGNAAVAYSLDDQQFLWSNRLDEPVAPTVVTKLVTAMVVMDILDEYGFSPANTNAVVTQTALDNCGNIYDPRVPVMALTVNTSYSVESLLQAMLVNNAYDAASVLAYHFGENYLGGDVDKFIDRMNKKVESLGLTKTKFVNATGVNSSEQYTTPREATLITAAFYGYNQLVTYSNVSEFSFGRTTVRNKNFLKNDYNVAGYTNKNAIGLIAGQLDRKGNYCLITATQDQGKTYIFIVMCASGMIIDSETTLWSFGEGNAYDDINKMISWVRESFELLTVATEDTIVGELRVDFGTSSDHVMVTPAEKIEKLVLKNGNAEIVTTVKYDETVVYKKEFNGTQCDTVSAPVTAGQKVGTVTFSYNGTELATVDAVVKEGIEEDVVLSGLAGIKNFLFGPVMKTILYILGGIIVVYVLVVIVMAVVRMVRRVSAMSAAAGAGAAISGGKRKKETDGDSKNKVKKPKEKPQNGSKTKNGAKKGRDLKGDTREIP